MWWRQSGSEVDRVKSSISNSQGDCSGLIVLYHLLPLVVGLSHNASSKRLHGCGKMAGIDTMHVKGQKINLIVWLPFKGKLIPWFPSWDFVNGEPLHCSLHERQREICADRLQWARKTISWLALAIVMQRTYFKESWHVCFYISHIWRRKKRKGRLHTASQNTLPI